jgi:hypothetical protein
MEIREELVFHFKIFKLLIFKLNTIHGEQGANKEPHDENGGEAVGLFRR